MSTNMTKVPGCSDESKENEQQEIAEDYLGYGDKGIDTVEDLAVNTAGKRSRRPPVWMKDYVRE